MPIAGGAAGHHAVPSRSIGHGDIMRALALVLMGIAAVATPAAADWQNTHWGQSVEQVAALFPGATKVTRLIPAIGEPDVTVRLYTDVDQGQRATFYFRGDRLARVDVDYADIKRCPGVLQQLRAQYGPPIANEKIYEVLSVFTWLSGRDEVTLRWLESGDGAGICALMQKSSFG